MYCWFTTLKTSGEGPRWWKGHRLGKEGLEWPFVSVKQARQNIYPYFKAHSFLFSSRIWFGLWSEPPSETPLFSLIVFSIDLASNAVSHYCLSSWAACVHAHHKESVPTMSPPLALCSPSLSRDYCAFSCPELALQLASGPGGPSLFALHLVFLTPGFLLPHKGQTGCSSLLPANSHLTGIEARSFLCPEPQNQVLLVLEWGLSPLSLCCSSDIFKDYLPCVKRQHWRVVLLILDSSCCGTGGGVTPGDLQPKGLKPVWGRPLKTMVGTQVDKQLPTLVSLHMTANAEIILVWNVNEGKGSPCC